MPERLRVFISSPGDVRAAREVAAQTVEKVAQNYLRHFIIEPYLWESEALQASGHFQDAIEPPGEFDIVILILWARLGTALPEETRVRRYEGIDGRFPVTGTEWEFEDALRASRERGTPDLMVYRCSDPASINAWDAGRRAAELDQLSALDAFWSRHFFDGGGFIGAYHQFSDLKAFGATLEGHLHKLVQKHVAILSSRADRGAVLWTSSPFRGLASYDFEHAPVFFGRSDAVGRAMRQLIGNAEDGCAFLLLLGSSGSGKSSIAKCGIAKKLALPHRVTGKDFCRRATFRIADRLPGEDLFDAFSRALTAVSDPRMGLPELGRPEALARHLRQAPGQPDQVFALALKAAGEVRHGDEPQLLVIVDQLEEIYGAEISTEERQGFITLISALARSGHVWVVATMRSDFWRRAGETPALIDLAQGFGRLDVGPATLSEIGEMLAGPAGAAGLAFERDPVSDLPLNAVIGEEAAASPGSLPLLSYLLEQLYEQDVIKGGGTTLTFATYEALGRLRGSIANRAETTLAAQNPETRDALRNLLFALVQVDTDETGEAVRSRQAHLDSLSLSARRLTEAFLGARLLVALSDTEGRAIVRVAHEALLVEWSRARDIITENAHFMRIRRRIEDVCERALTLPDAKAALLTGYDLADGRRLTAAFGPQLSEAIRAFITQSDVSERRSRQRNLMVSGAIAAIMSVLFVVAATLYLVTRQEEQDLRDLIGAGHDIFVADDQAIRKGIVSGKYDDVIQLSSKLIALGETLKRTMPDNDQVLYNIANAYADEMLALEYRRKSNDLERARQSYARAVALAASLSLRDARSPSVRQERLGLQGFLAKHADDLNP